MVLLAQAKNKVLLLQKLGRDGRFDRPGEKQRMSIAGAERLQDFVPAEQLVVEFGKSEFVIKMQPRLQIFR